MALSSLARKKELDRIKSTDDLVVRTGEKLKYGDGSKLFNVYRIDMDYVIYNPYNGRIGSLIKSHEEQYGKLSPEKDDDIKTIERFLWDSKADRNEKTEENLVKYHQQRFGIVTSDGVIIDGNRRAMLIRKIFQKRNTEYKNSDVEWARYFEAIILDEGAEERDIIRLETIYQMGEDEKLGYNAIEKYLKIKDLKNNQFELADIADFMNEDPKQVERWWETMQLMDGYLDYLGYANIYTQLDKREDQFLNLNEWIKRYNGKSRSTMIDWDYGEDDISDLKAIAFDYIRAMWEGKDFRNLANTSRKNPGAFYYKETWDKLKEIHQKVESVNTAEKPIEQYQQEYPDIDDKTLLLEKRDQEWTEKVEDVLKEEIGRTQNMIRAKVNEDGQGKILEEVLDLLESVDVSSKGFSNSKNYDLVDAIRKKAEEFKKILRDYKTNS
jgi:hypothetical protein